MNWGVDDNLNIVLTEKSGFLLNGASELDRVEWNRSKIIWKHDLALF